MHKVNEKGARFFIFGNMKLEQDGKISLAVFYFVNIFINLFKCVLYGAPNRPPLMGCQENGTDFKPA